MSGPASGCICYPAWFRIPMRGYETGYTYTTNVRLSVPNPHEGL